MYFSLFTLSQNTTNCNHDCELARHTWKMSPHYLMKCRTHSPDGRRVYCFPPDVDGSEKGKLCYVATWMSGKQCHSNYLFYVGMRASLGIWGPHWGLRRLCFYGAKISKVRIRPLNDSAQRNHHELKSHLFWRTLPNFFQGGTGSIRATVTLGRASSSLVSTVC